jgi:predicted chitinase
MFYTGIVESRTDPLELGRCQVRIVGLHTHDKTQLPTNELPWATPIQPISSAAMNGIGYTPVGPVEGTTVIIMFADDSMQQPLIFGTVGGIPQTPIPISDDDSSNVIQDVRTKDIVLRTIVGPTSGKQLIFYSKTTPDGTGNPETITNNPVVTGALNDAYARYKAGVQSGTVFTNTTSTVSTPAASVPKSESTVDLTAGLKANMKVVGFGLSQSCTIVSIDGKDRITISEEVVGYGENIITFKDPATNIDAVNKSKVEGVVTTSSGEPLLDGQGQPVKTKPPEQSVSVPAPIIKSNTNDSIPTIPPPKVTPNASKATNGIKALIAAADKVGLTTKEQKCALLAICGGESAWIIPNPEGYSYSEERLKQIFSFATDATAKQFARADKKGVTREQFFSWVYGPSQRGKNFLGNKTDADGGKYYGRGFIQLTGRDNYIKYQKQANALGANLDIVNNPDSIDNDINTAALIAALFVKDTTPKKVSPTAHPAFFEAAKNAAGHNSPDIAATKLKCYEYFYGGKATDSVEKNAGVPAPEPPKETTQNIPVTPGPSLESISRGTDNIGFRDPNNKYPLKDYINEPDTNRLARGILNGTIIEKKDATRKTGIPIANGTGSWDQPLSAFGAKYPYNKVMETESGHIQEFDDTPGQERIHTYHRAGTYTEIDPNGSQVNYIVGENFVLMERNGFIQVGGDCNITVDGNTNIYARTDANIQVEHNATITAGNNLSIGAANDLDIAVGGNIQIKAAGSLKIAADNMTVKSANNLLLQAGQGASIKSGIMQLESTSTMDIKTASVLHVGYSTGQFGNGASGAQDVDSFNLEPPPSGSPFGANVPALQPPSRQTEEIQTLETPEDYATPEGRKFSNDQSQTTGVPTPPPIVATDSPAVATGGKDQKIPADCKIIFNTTNFPLDYRLSKNFTLGMLIPNSKHKLVDQTLKDTPKGPDVVYTVQQIVCNLANLCTNILEVYLDAGILPGGIGGYRKQWDISSGYRLFGVIQQETLTSSHCKGQAVDIILNLPDKINKTYELIQKMEKLVNYDQLILEYRYPNQCWIHSAYVAKSNRKMAFTMVNDATYPSGKFGSFTLVGDGAPPQAKKV